MTDFIFKDPRKAENHAQRAQRELEIHRGLVGARKQAQASVMPDDVGVDIRIVEWPNERKPKELREYDCDHHRLTSRLAVHIAGGFETPLTQTELRVLKAAAMLHDLGREESWSHLDPGHAQRSAALAEAHMRQTPVWSQREFINEVCKTILQHSLQKAPVGPILTALHDAECFESVRLAPTTVEGAKLMARRMGQVVTSWAKNIDHQRRWRDFRKSYVSQADGSEGGSGGTSPGGIILP